jgi:hypothetical protein
MDEAEIRGALADHVITYKGAKYRAALVRMRTSPEWKEDADAFDLDFTAAPVDRAGDPNPVRASHVAEHVERPTVLAQRYQRNGGRHSRWSAAAQRVRASVGRGARICCCFSENYMRIMKTVVRVLLVLLIIGAAVQVLPALLVSLALSLLPTLIPRRSVSGPLLSREHCSS